MPNVTQLFVYFNFRNEDYYTQHGEHLGSGVFESKAGRVTSMGAALFDKDLSEPTWMKINRWGFNKCLKEGEAFQWLPTTEFLTMGGSGELIPVENLIQTP
jgi:hypothetical protein